MNGKPMNDLMGKVFSAYTNASIHGKAKLRIGRDDLVPRAGFEPATPSLEGSCSHPSELTGHGNNGDGIIAHKEEKPEYQIWACQMCERERHWGFGGLSHESAKTPLLNCFRCRIKTRHFYSGIVRSREDYPEIDFGRWWQVRRSAE